MSDHQHYLKQQCPRRRLACSSPGWRPRHEHNHNTCKIVSLGQMRRRKIHVRVEQVCRGVDTECRDTSKEKNKK